MKLLQVAYVGMSGFAGGTLDLRAIPPGLVTLSGPNWNGKTTLLELPLAVFYREWASRENNEISWWADRRDSWVEALFERDGVTYKARVSIDGTTRKSHAVVQQQAAGGGWRLLTDGKVSTYDAMMATLVPPKAALLSSQFAAQNRSGSLTSAGKSERKDLFIHFLWLERLIEMGQTAKACADLAERTVGDLTVRQRTLQEHCSDEELAATIARLHDVVASQVRDRAALAELETGIAGLEETLVDVQSGADAFVRAESDHAAAHQERLSARSTREDLPRRRDQARSACERASASTRARHARDRVILDKKRAALVELQANAPAITEAVALMTLHEERLQIAREDLETAQASLTLAVVGASRQRAVRTADAVPCGGLAVYGACRFLAEAAEAQAQLGDQVTFDWPAEVARLQAVLVTRRATIADTTETLARLRPLAVQVLRLDVVDDRLRELDDEWRKIDADLQVECDAHDALLDLAVAEIDALDVELATTLETLAHRVSRLAADMEVTRASRDERQHVQQALSAARQEATTLREALAEAGVLRTRYEAQVDALGQTRAKVQALTPKIAAAHALARSYAFLAKALHRDGLPTLEIAAAAPAISTLTTDLLEHSGFGSRFRVDVTTLVPTADGKGWKEDFAIRIFDNVRGKHVLGVGDLSGGERIMVEEALRAALTIYMAARTGHPVKTCWRDETTGPLDKENRPRYVAMLRRLRQLGQYDHVIYVSHADDAVDAADTILEVRQGQVTRRRG